MTEQQQHYYKQKNTRPEVKEAKTRQTRYRLKTHPEYVISSYITTTRLL